MIQGETILCLSPTPWFSLWRNRQQVMSRLATSNRVVFVEPDRTFGEAGVRGKPHVQTVAENLEVVQPPPSLPFGARFMPRIMVSASCLAVAKLNNALLACFLRGLLKARRLSTPILWLYDPLHVDVLGSFGEKLVVYHVHDDTSAYPFNLPIRELIKHKQRVLLSKADLVFHCSKTLYESHEGSYSNAYYVPNGGDFPLFNRVDSTDMAVPDEIREIPGPKVLFYGAIDFRLDMDLLYFLARQKPHWSFVLLGQNLLGQHASDALRAFRNVYLLDRREYQTLPGYVNAVDVVIFPYKVPGYAGISSTPLKLYECLASGKPVVSAALPMGGEELEVVRIGHNHMEFLEQIQAALRDSNLDRKGKGIEIARANSWDQRVDTMSTLMEETLRRRYPDACRSHVGATSVAP